MNIVDKIQFSESLIHSFKGASKDENPLHSDERYASKTLFGEPVVYGILTFLYSLSTWQKDKILTLSDVKLKFKKPILRNLDYTLWCKEDNNRVVLELRRGETLYSKFIFSYDSNEDEEDLDIFKLNIDGQQVYEIDKGKFKELLKKIDMKEGQLPLQQVIFLLWTSFHVGMEDPGKQALYTQCEVKSFNQFTNNLNNFSVQRNDVFKRILIEGNISEECKFSITVTERPENVHYSQTEIIEKIQVYSTFKDKTILITGANRGFGAVLAKAFALQKCRRLILCYRSNDDSMEKVLSEIKDKVDVKVCKVDLSKDASPMQLMNELLPSGINTIDYFFNNAAPAIKVINFDEFNQQQFLEELNLFISIAFNSLKCAGDLLNAKGEFVNISTTFVSESQPGFSHYISAKSAIEAMLNTYKVENQKGFEVKNFRLPKMLTDQTNAPLISEEIANPVDLCQKLLLCISEQKTYSSMVELR